MIVSLSDRIHKLQLTEAQIKMQAQQDAELETDQTMSGDTDTLSQAHPLLIQVLRRKLHLQQDRVR